MSTADGRKNVCPGRRRPNGTRTRWLGSGLLRNGSNWRKRSAIIVLPSKRNNLSPKEKLKKLPPGRGLLPIGRPNLACPFASTSLLRHKFERQYRCSRIVCHGQRPLGVFPEHAAQLSQHLPAQPKCLTTNLREVHQISTFRIRLRYTIDDVEVIAGHCRAPVAG